MQLQSIYVLALVGLGATTTTTSVPVTSTSTGPQTTISICEDYTWPCGSPPTATLWYGGCHDIRIKTTYTPPPCPTPVSTSSPCTSTGTICDERFRTCGSPTPTTTLSYGICHDACVVVTYSQPPCPTPTSSTRTVTSSSTCTRTGTICEDHLKSCGTPTPTAILTYGGCHGACERVTYSPPPCPTPTAACKGR